MCRRERSEIIATPWTITGARGINNGQTRREGHYSPRRLDCDRGGKIPLTIALDNTSPDRNGLRFISPRFFPPFSSACNRSLARQRGVARTGSGDVRSAVPIWRGNVTHDRMTRGNSSIFPVEIISARSFVSPFLLRPLDDTGETCRADVAWRLTPRNAPFFSRAI